VSHPSRWPPFQPPDPSRREDATWLEPYPDVLLRDVTDLAHGPDARYEARETVELGVRREPAAPAAPANRVLVLRDVLGFSAAEVAAMLDTSEMQSKACCVERGLHSMRGALSTVAPPSDSNQERELAGASPTPSPPATSTVSSRCSPTTHGSACHLRPSYCGPTAITAFLRVSLAWRRLGGHGPTRGADRAHTCG